MKRVLLTGPILTKSGYGEHARLVYRALKSVSNEQSIDLYIEPLNWGKTGWMWEDTSERRDIDEHIFRTAQYEGEYDVHIHVGILNEFNPQAEKTVCVTAGIETTKVSPSWLERAKTVDKIIVPSMHSKWVFENTSYNSPTGEKLAIESKDKVAVWPYVILNPAAKIDLDLDLKTNFNFLTVAQFSPRKNIEFLLENFIKEFHDDSDVGLVAKLSIASNNIIDFHITKDHLNALLANYPDRKCKIYLLHGDFLEAEMMGLYSNEKIKAYITTTHGEGYGLPIFEAAQFDIPVVAPRYSGHLDFLYAPSTAEEETPARVPKFLSIDVELRHVQREALMPELIVRDAMWAFPDPEQFRSHIRSLVDDYNRFKKQAEELGEHIRNSYREEDIYPGLILDLIGPVTEWENYLSEVEIVS